MSEVPLTLTDLKTEFGKNMLLATLSIFGVSNSDSRPAVIEAPQAELVGVADEWRHNNPEEVKILGAHAQRLLVKLPGEVGGALASVRSDLVNELPGIPDGSHYKARYLVDVFGQLTGQSLEDMEKCLKAIVAFGNGE